MKYLQERKTVTYDRKEDGTLCGVLTEIIQKYVYESEEEKLKHRDEMIRSGYDDTGQVKENFGTIMEPKLVWFGCYRYERYETVTRE